MKIIKELGARWIIGIFMITSTFILAPLLLEAEYVNQPMDSVSGSFTSSGFVSEPFILDLALFNFSKSTEVALISGSGAMTPQVEHQLTFKVGYGDGMGGESNNPLQDFFVNIKVLYLEACTLDDPCSESELIEAFNAINLTTPDAGVFRYNFSPSAFELISDVAIMHTWEILQESGVTEVDVLPPDAENTTENLVSGYAFDFRFKPSKTAMEDFEDGSWIVMVEFGINNGPAGYESLTGFKMEWYGEIDVASGTQAIWTGLDVQEFQNDDSDYRFTNLSNQAQGWQGISYISNGPYIHTNQANETTWTSDRGFEASLVTSTDPNHPLDPQEFMIRINTLNTFEPTLRAQQLVNDRVDLNNMLQRSLESGREKNFYVFIRLAPSFQNAVYSGTIDFGISNLPADERGNVERSTVGFMFGDEQYPTQKIPLTSPEDLAKLSTIEEGFIVIGAGTVYERLYFITPSASNFVLASDINLSGVAWTPIGTEAQPFTGSLVGNQFEIQDLTITGSDDNVGLFGHAVGASFENLVLTNVAISGNENVGALVGNGSTVIITDVKVSGTVSGSTQVGAVAGFITQNSRSILSRIENFASVSGTEKVGGLVGLLTGTIQESINRGPVTANANGSGISNVGGLVGQTDSNGTSQPVIVKNSYNTAAVNGTNGSNVGGLIGNLAAGTLENSLNIGEVSGNGSVGGVVGNAESASNVIKSIFKKTNDFNPGIAAIGGSGAVNLEEDQLRNVFNYENWDFSEAWGINVFDDSVNNRFPILQWEGKEILDIRADIIPPSANTLTGIQTFTIRAGVGPSHPVGLQSWTLELIRDPNNTAGEFEVLRTSTFGAIGINQSINIDTIFERNLEHKFLLTVTDNDGRVVTKAAIFNIFNPVASGAVNIIEDGDTQIVVNFDSQVSIRDGVTLTGSAFVIELYEFNISNLQATPDPTTFADADIDVSQNRGTLRLTIDPEDVSSVTLINNVLTISIPSGINLPQGDRLYFRLRFLEEAQNNIINVGENPLSTTYARDLVRPLAIRVSDFTSQGLSGSSGFFPRGYSFTVTEDIIVTRLIGGHSGTSDTDVFELRLYEVQSTTNPRPLDINNPIVRFELKGAPTNQKTNHHFAQSEYVIGDNEEGVRLVPGKVYLLVQFRVSGGGAHYRAAGTIDYNQINTFNTRITNWGPTTGGNWRFVNGGLSALATARIESENTRPSLGFRYRIPTGANEGLASYSKLDAKPANPPN